MVRERQPLLPSIKPSDMGGGFGRWSETEIRRGISFFMAVLCGLASGSNYGYSAYAPQLASRLHLSSTHANLVGTAGNLGMYLTGPLWGKLVDSRGQRLPLLIGGLLVFAGYSTVHAFYALTIPIRSDPSDPPSHIGLFFLCLAMFTSGCGGTGGLTAALNATAKSFSDKSRASASGTVLAGFGLSAFLFSTVGHLLFGGDAGGLLLLLAFGAGIPLVIGSFVVRPIPPQHDTAAYEPLANDSEVLLDEEEVHHGTSEAQLRRRSTSLELSRSPSRSLSPTTGSASRARAHLPHRLSDAVPELNTTKHTRHLPSSAAYSPVELIHSFDFWLLFTVLALLCGTGLMYINNAGTVALALARDGQVEYDKKTISAWQARQVATVSIWNCAGRIIGGIVSDFSKTRFGIQRIWFLPVIAMLFIVSQIVGLDTINVKHLWIVSTNLGLAYGGLFNVLPMLVLEWFGMAHFSQNYGWITVAPVIGGNVFNILFGRIYDSNTVGRIGLPKSDALNLEVLRALARRAGDFLSDEAKHDCLIGARCYSTAFKISTFGCFVALGLSIVAGVRRERALRDEKRASLDVSHR